MKILLLFAVVFKSHQKRKKKSGLRCCFLCVFFFFKSLTTALDSCRSTFGTHNVSERQSKDPDEGWGRVYKRDLD